MLNPLFPIALGALMVAAIAADRWLVRLGIPAPLPFFLIGLLIPDQALPRMARTEGVQRLDAYAACLLVFAAGFQLSRRLVKSRRLLRAGLLLALPGTLLAIALMALVLNLVISALIGLGWAPAMTTLGRHLLALALAVCLAPTDWGLVVFISRRLHRQDADLIHLQDFEAALSCAMTVMVAAVGIEILKHGGGNPDASQVLMEVLAFCGGLAMALISGAVLAVLMIDVLHRFVRHRSHQMVVLLGFLLIGLGSQSLVGHGALVCAFVMGIVSSFRLDRKGLAAEKHELESDIEAINLVAEVMIFFFAGVAVTTYQLPLTLLLTLVLLLLLALLRPGVVALFTLGSGLSGPQRGTLASSQPKGAISIGLAAATPELIDAGAKPHAPVLEQFLQGGLLLEVVVAVVLLSMVVQVLLPLRLAAQRT